MRVLHSVENEDKRRFSPLFGKGENVLRFAVLKVGYFRDEPLMLFTRRLAVQHFFIVEKNFNTARFRVFEVARGYQPVYGGTRFQRLGNGVTSDYFHCFYFP